MNPHAIAAYIKGWEYVIAIVFNLLFLAFWMLIARQRTAGQERSAR